VDRLGNQTFLHVSAWEILTEIFSIYFYDVLKFCFAFKHLFCIYNEQDWIEYITTQYRAFAFWTGLHFHPGDKTWYWTNEQQADMTLM
jgi:hypothetical protein